MDDIIQIIVFFFIIYSILAPIFGKKKQQQNAYKKKPTSTMEGESKSGSPSNSSSRDIFEEILGFKIPKTDNDYSRTEEYPTGDRELRTINYETELQTDYRNLEKESKIPDGNYEKLAAKIKAEAEAPHLHYDLQKSYEENAKLVELKKRFKEPTTIKDFVLVSEILNKPKALRK